MRICHVYAEMPFATTPIELKNPAFKIRVRVEVINNAIQTTYWEQGAEVKVEDIEHRLFCAMLQNENWDIVDLFREEG